MRLVILLLLLSGCADDPCTEIAKSVHVLEQQVVAPSSYEAYERAVKLVDAKRTQREMKCDISY